ncbi:hypothetical protein JZ751_024924, partial [Albula glossodonta]
RRAGRWWEEFTPAGYATGLLDKNRALGVEPEESQEAVFRAAVLDGASRSFEGDGCHENGRQVWSRLTREELEPCLT